MRSSLAQIFIASSLLSLATGGCAGEAERVGAPSDLARQDAEMSARNAAGDGKGDELVASFPAERDLTLVIPRDSARLRALEVIPMEWLEAVDEALFRSEIDEYISDESWPEDWRLVSARISPCSPLGRIADREEIDRLCWPGVRLVFQPITERIKVNGLIREFYAEDRAIHVLYRVSYESPQLGEMQAILGEGARLVDLPEDMLIEFEAARDESSRWLLNRVRALRLTEGPYQKIDDRPEFFEDDALASSFWDTLKREVLEIDCIPEALHELTAFSLPLGRQPASADLWSFVAFHGANGEINQVALEVLDARNGDILLSFDGEGDALSEDVTTTAGDPQMNEVLAEMDGERRAQLEAQIIVNVDQIATHADQIFDPYQTLVPHTTCSSCHRANNLLFNFHNLSYFEDQDLSVSPRTRADVRRDLEWVKGLDKRLE